MPSPMVCRGARALLSSTQDVGSGAAAETYAYVPGTNRLASVANAAGTRTIGYDARGNTASELRPGGVSVATAYDGYGRLTGYSRSGGQSLAFAYNGLDDRVTMVLGNDTRRFVYDADGRVLGEYGNSVADVKAELIWLLPRAANDNAFGGDDGMAGHAPLAVATPDLMGAIRLNWVHGNHLGVPLVITDAGGAPAATPNDYLAPGFPGQSRVLPDLYYNRYRDYDPTIGRYIQADPIGLEGGSNSYAYVGGNPVNWIDPMGLAPQSRRYTVPCGRCILIYDTDPVKGSHTHWQCPGQAQGCIKKDGSPCDGSPPPPPNIEDCLKRRGRIPQDWCPGNASPMPTTPSLPPVPTKESWLGAFTAGAVAIIAGVAYVLTTTF